MANPILQQLKANLAVAEQRQRMAARRIAWMEQTIYQSNTEDEFNRRNAEIEQAITEAQEIGMQVQRARGEFATADITARYGTPTAG